MIYNPKDNQNGTDSIFRGLGRLVNVIVDMAEKNVTEKKGEGELFSGDNDSGLQGKYQFKMKLGIGDSDIEHLAQDNQFVEPQTEIFKEDGYTLIIAEMPEVREEDFKYSIQDNFLHLTGRSSSRTYKKCIDISGLNVDLNMVRVTENNGIYKIVLECSQPGDSTKIIEL